MLAPELDAFIASYLAAPSAQEAAAPAEEAPATVAEPITGTLSAYGYSVSYSATVGTATVTYPADVIYEEDIATCSMASTSRSPLPVPWSSPILRP